jgi:DNA polymerase-3 subunit alpha
MAKQYANLHTHSHYSLLDGLGKIDKLVWRAKELQMPALALTDHGVLYGAIEFWQKCLEAEIKPIIGVEVYVAPRKLSDKDPRFDTHPTHLILLAKNNQGYQNLLKLVTISHLEGFYYKPRIDLEVLAKYGQGLIATSACMHGIVSLPLLQDDGKSAKENLKKMQKIFGKDFYLELQFHPESKDQEKVNKGLCKLAKSNNVPLVVTNDVHYVNQTDKNAHEILLAVQTGKDIDDEERLSLQKYNLSLQSLEQIFQNTQGYSESERKQIDQAIDNTIKIANQCNLELNLGKVILPEFPLPKGTTAKKYLEQIALKGLEKRYNHNPQAKERFNYEISIIEKTGFAPYFLIVSDFVNFAKNSGIIVGPGRGSAAGSIVSYCLNITNVDPLKYNLLFERFLNPERIAPPDIDLDFQDDRRDEVIRYISQKYGKDHVAQIITFGTMASRGAIRDVARAMRLSYDDGDKVAKLIPFGLNLDQALQAVPDLLEMYNSDQSVKQLIDMAKQLEGVARHASTHAAGIVISREPLVNYTALQHPPQDDSAVITQYSMYDIEKIGLLKMDILGLANLTIIKNALRIIRKLENQEINIDQIPLDDKKTFQLLSKGETVGVFQLESEGMRRYLKELKPTDLSDIIAMVALYRPGPMELIPDYIAGKHGRKEIIYYHPKLKPILSDTYGIAVYQEQVLQIARDIAGFTLGEADILRKAIGKKIQKLLVQQEKKFVDGAVKNGVKEKIAQRLFEFVKPFAQYGFNRAHAACYGLIAYQTAYLKAHYPAAFLAALLSSEYKNLDKIAIAIKEAERVGVKVLPPDINESFVEFGVIKGEKSYIRFGLMAIKNVGTGVAAAIVQEQAENGPYKNLQDFLLRLGPTVLNKKVIEALAKSGALDQMGERNQILAGMEEILKFISLTKKHKENGQLDLFGGLKTTTSPIEASLILPKMEKADKNQRLVWEKEFLGIYLSEHPLKDFSHLLKATATPLASINHNHANKSVKVAGVITNIKKINTKNGQNMLFVRLEDMTSSTELLVFPNTLAQKPTIWRINNIILVNGKVTTKDGEVKIIADRVKEIGRQETLLEAPSLHLHLPKAITKTLLQNLQQIVTSQRGQSKVYFHIIQKDKAKVLPIKTQVQIDGQLLGKLANLLGKDKVEVQDE